MNNSELKELYNRTDKTVSFAEFKRLFKGQSELCASASAFYQKEIERQNKTYYDAHA